MAQLSTLISRYRLSPHEHTYLFRLHRSIHHALLTSPKYSLRSVTERRQVPNDAYVEDIATITFPSSLGGVCSPSPSSSPSPSPSSSSSLRHYHFELQHLNRNSDDRIRFYRQPMIYVPLDEVIYVSNEHFRSAKYPQFAYSVPRGTFALFQSELPTRCLVMHAR